MNDTDIMQEVDRHYHRNETSEGRVNAITDYITRLLREKDAELALRTQAQRDALAVVYAARELVESFTLMNDAGWWQPKKDVSMAERDSKISAVYAALAALPPVPDSGERE